MIRAGGARLADSDPVDLVELLALAAALREAIDAAVQGMRASGATWAEIGAATGTSRQAAFQKWGEGRTAGTVNAPPIAQACRQLASSEPSRG